MNLKVYVIFLLNMLMMETKVNLYYIYEYKKKNFYSNNKLKFQPRT